MMFVLLYILVATVVKHRTIVFSQLVSYTGTVKRFFFSLLLLIGGAIGVSGQPVLPAIEPTFVYAAQAEQLLGEDVIRAGLFFSLCPAENHDAFVAQYKALEAEVLSDAYQSLPELERGEKILALMYDRVLDRYVSNQTKIDTMFSDGTYNCVSSSVLYFALARAAGLTVAGQETPDHAFCTLYIGDKKIDVETTNPGGFNPGTKKVVSQTEKSTRYFVVPKKYYSGRREVGERKFVSLVGRNLVASMNDKNDYEPCIPLSAARLVFVGEMPAKDASDARADFDSMCGNVAGLLDKKHFSAQALDWLDAVYARWGKTPALQKNYDIIAYNNALAAIRAKDFDNARADVLRRQENLSPQNLKKIQTTILTAYIDARVETLPPDEAIVFLHGQRAEPLANEKEVFSRINEQEEYCWYQKIKPVFDGGDYLAAAAIADEGLAFVPNSRNLKTIRNQCMQNYAVDVHNAFADLSNAGKYDEAVQVVQAGLQVYPTSTMLKNDLKRVQQFLQRQ